MKIILIGPIYPYRGGIATYNEILVTKFQEQGHDIKAYTFTMQYPNFLFPGKTQYSEGKAPENLQILRCINSVNPLNWNTIGNQIKKEKPDLIIVRFWLPFMGPCFGSILRKVKKNKHSKIICLVDNMIPHEKRIGDTIFTKYFVKPIDGFLAMSENVYNDINQFAPNKPKILSPHPLFDNFGDIVPREKALENLKLDPKYRYLLFFGLIRKYKGLDLLIEAFAHKKFRKSNIKLIIAGEYYSDKEEYENLIKKHNLEADIIQVAKFIPDSDVQDFFNACDLVVQPYKSATQSGVTQIAYHFNKPMVVTNVGGLEKMCPDGKVGYVVSTNPDDIAKAIFRFFEETDQQKMIENIIEEKKKYSWEILTQNITKLKDKIVI